MVSLSPQTSTAAGAIGRRPIDWLGQFRGLPLLPLLILVPFVLVAVFADYIAPYDPTEPVAGMKIFTPPAWMQGGHIRVLLGTDFQGRDIVSRLIFGARVSLIVGVTGTVVAGGIGTLLGVLAGYLGGWGGRVGMCVGA